MAINLTNTINEWRLAYNDLDSDLTVAENNILGNDSDIAALDSDLSNILITGELSLGSNWRIFIDSGILKVEYNGNVVATLDNSGNLIIEGTVDTVGSI